VFGTKKCRDTQKALRFFKDRGIDVQFRDIAEKEPSPGELEDISRAIGGCENLIDLEGAAAKKRGLSYMSYDARTELLRDPLLMRTPVVRLGKGVACVGISEPDWKRYAEEAKTKTARSG